MQSMAIKSSTQYTALVILNPIVSSNDLLPFLRQTIHEF